MKEIAELFHRITLGVYVVGVAHDERRDALTAAWVMQASFDPPLLALGINPLNASYALLHGSGTFTVNVLKQGQLDVARRFGTESGREHDKLAYAGIRATAVLPSWMRRWRTSTASSQAACMLATTR